MPAINRELLERFWLGLCTEEEATLVEAYFREHPEDESLLEEFESTSGDPLIEDDKVEMLSVVLKATKPRGAAIPRIGSMIAAASVLIVCVAGWLLYRPAGHAPITKPVLEAAVWVGKHNADDKNVRVALPDSTETILAPGATIIYRKDLGSYDKREVKVQGRVVFSVRRNKEQPFIVYSDEIRTTVLGTIFEVNNEAGSERIRIRLLQGKVAVGDSSKQYYLKPGEEFVYERD